MTKQPHWQATSDTSHEKVSYGTELQQQISQRRDVRTMQAVTVYFCLYWYHPSYR